MMAARTSAFGTTFGSGCSSMSSAHLSTRSRGERVSSPSRSSRVEEDRSSKTIDVRTAITGKSISRGAFAWLPYLPLCPMADWNALIIDAALPSAIAGGVAVAATVLVERLGGRIGGLVSSVPTTIIPAAVALHTRCESPDDFATAMALVPIGTALNAGYLGLWLLLPPFLCAHRIGHRAPLAFTLTIALAAWIAASTALILLGALAQPSASDWQGAALVATLLCAALGVIANWTPTDAPRGTRRVQPRTLLFRGVAAAGAIGAAVILARLDVPIASGLVSVFPVIFTTVMVGTWLAQGASVPRGAAAPMMLGSTSVAVFACLAAVLFPRLDATPSVVLAWLGSVLIVHAPASVLLWWRTRVSTARAHHA